MNAVAVEANLRSLYFQRNIFACLTVILSLSLVVLSGFLFLKRERVVITPAVVAKEFWVDAASVSPTYLEQMGLFVGHLLLHKSSQSAAEQRQVILRHTDASYSGLMRQRLIEEEKGLIQQNIAYTFYPIDIKVDVDKLEVKLSGDRIAFAGSQQVSMQKEAYLLQFIYSGSRLLLKSITALEST